MTKKKTCRICGSTDRMESKALCKPCYATQQQKAYRTARGRASALCAQARRRAKKLGVKFDLDVDWFYRRIKEGRCELTGLKFQLGPYQNKRTNPWAPSPDRIQPGGDYTKENCRLVLYWINNALNEFGEATLEVIASRILKTKGYSVASPFTAPVRRCNDTDDLFRRDRRATKRAS